MRNSPRAFTLIELMVVMLIFSIIVLAILGVLLIGRQSWKTGGTQLELQQESRRGMDWMVRELRQSGVNYAEYAGESIAIVGGVSITFRQAQGWDSANDRVDWAGERITYAVGGTNSDQLIRTTVNDSGTTTSTTILANNVQSLQFRRNADVVDILLQVQKEALQGRTLQSTLYSKVKLRNQLP